MFDVSFTSSTTGTVVGMGSTILHTSDGGAHWNLQTTGTSRDFRGVYFSDANTGTAVGSVGTICRTTNGGTTWSSQTSGTTSWLTAVYFVDANTGTAVVEERCGRRRSAEQHMASWMWCLRMPAPERQWETTG
jgi:photosystem II stability/assembly factor-like uncharacterized protein